jgi:23S rRNA U2552 (ribose-2'-O)-methylase RlmE/FtsJ
MAPKSVVAPTSKAPSSNSQLSRPQFHNRARVNHVDVQEVQQAPGVVLIEFLIEFTPATLLFDSRASHYFIAASFLKRHGIPTTPLEAP